MAKATNVKWPDAPAGHDYPAAESYLRLSAPATAGLPADDPEARQALKKIARGKRLSPNLLVRGNPGWGAHLNPVVSKAVALGGDFGWRRVPRPRYVAAQFVDAVVAVFVLRGAFGVQRRPGGGSDHV